MPNARHSTLSAALNAEFRFEVIPDPDGGYVIRSPDLRGCITQVETLEDIPAAAREIRELWIETLYDSDPAALMELLKQPA